MSSSDVILREMSLLFNLRHNDAIHYGLYMFTNEFWVDVYPAECGYFYTSIFIPFNYKGCIVKLGKRDIV